MVGYNPAYTPMEEKLRLIRQNTTKVDSTHCHRYLMHTWPDLAFVIRYVSRFMEQPTVEHLQAVKRVLHYVAGTIDLWSALQEGPRHGALHQLL